MLPEPRWKSLELLIINSCMRERAQTQMDARTPPSPPQISPLPGTGAEALPPTHMCCTGGPGCPQPPGEGGPWEPSLASRSSAAPGKAFAFLLPAPQAAGGGVPPFSLQEKPVSEGASRALARELQASGSRCPPGMRDCGLRALRGGSAECLGVNLTLLG